MGSDRTIAKGLAAGVSKAVAKIVVNVDGTFVASELPEDLQVNSKTLLRVDSGAGVWKLTSREGAELQLNFYDLPSGDGNTHGPYGFGISVSRGWAATSLYYSLGDPDEMRRVTFEKR